MSNGENQPTIVTLQCTTGKVDARVGDQFDGGHNGVWEIVRFGDDRSYSPSSLGGCPTVIARPLSGQIPSWFEKYRNSDGTIDWCGDSVAAYLLTGVDGNPRSSRGDMLRTARNKPHD